MTSDLQFFKAPRYFPFITNRFIVEYLPASPNYGVSVDTYAVVVIENKETGERVEIPVSYPLDDQTMINTVDLLLEFIMKKLNTDFK